jgi:hypothetical protein
MNPTETPEDRAQESSAPKEPEKPRGRPKRVKSVNPQTAAIEFVNAVAGYFESKGLTFNQHTILEMRTLFRNYCFHKGLRGKQKDSVWRAVESLIREAKAAAKELQTDIEAKAKPE